MTARAPYRDATGRPRYPIDREHSENVLALLPGRIGMVDTVGQVAAILRLQAADSPAPAAERDRVRGLLAAAEAILAALDPAHQSQMTIARVVAHHAAGDPDALDAAARLMVDALRAQEAFWAKEARPGRRRRSFAREATRLLAPRVVAQGGDAALLAALAAIAIDAAGAGQHRGTEANLRREAAIALRVSG